MKTQDRIDVRRTALVRWVVVAIASLTASSSGCSGGANGCSRGCSSGCGGGDDDRRRRDEHPASEPSGVNQAAHAQAPLTGGEPEVTLAAASATTLPPAGAVATLPQVARHDGVSYVQLVVEGSVDLDIEVDAPSVGRRVVPSSVVNASTRSGNALPLPFPEPVNVVVRIDDIEKLLLLDEPLEGAPLPEMENEVSVADLDPSGNARGVDTTAIQHAIDATSAAPGGGALRLPAGRYATGTLRVGSNVTLCVAAGALHEASPDPDDAPIGSGHFGKSATFSQILLIDHASHVQIRLERP